MRTVVVAGWALGSVLLVGCQVATDFSLKPVAETDDALCLDGRDDDFDGLADCQDWNCLGRVPCCDIPEVLLEDDFQDGPADCDAPACAEATCAETRCGPDDARWHAWPCPIAKVCGGQLRIDKGACYPGGVLSRSTAALGPGLTVAADVVGRPERLGYLEIALTQQTERDLPGALDACGRLQPVTGFAAARVTWAEDGLQVVAYFRELEAGRSAVVPVAPRPHRVVISIDRDRRISYALDGVTFATADVPVPITDAEARLALTGLTESAAFESIRVEAGIRCHDPVSWTPRGVDVAGEPDIERSVMLVGDAVTPSAFDADEVYHPTLRPTPDGLEVFYTGCWWPAAMPACDAFGVAIGRATLPAGSGGGLVRDLGGNPWVLPSDLTLAGVLLDAINSEMSVGLVTGAETRAAYVPIKGWGQSLVGLDDEMSATGRALAQAETEAWDGGIVCCATAVDGADGVRRLWYAGQGLGDDPVWRIGLATSTDGATFTRSGAGPVIGEGADASFDGGGVSNPTVIFDATRGLYRMWYEGHDFFGKVTIGYAVSTDGVTWSRFPGNPVLTPEGLGLTTIGGPAVHLGDDSRLLMLFHGTSVTEPRRRIFALTNDGRQVGGALP